MAGEVKIDVFFVDAVGLAVEGGVNMDEFSEEVVSLKNVSGPE